MRALLALCVVVLLTTGYANPLPSPADSTEMKGDTIEATPAEEASVTPLLLAEADTRYCPECGAANPADSKFCSKCGAPLYRLAAGAASVEVRPVEHYSWAAGLFGNLLLPGLGYFLIDEWGWGVGELVLVGGCVTLALTGNSTSGYYDEDGYYYEESSSSGAVWWIVGSSINLACLIHAPLLADWKNAHQAVSLDLSPGLGVASNGECYPTLNLALRF